MKVRHSFLLLLILALVAPAARAQKQVPPPAYPLQSEGCAPAEASAYLDVNNVRARLYNHGGLFWRGASNIYTVPKDGPANAVFATNIWIGGLVGGERRFAGTDYGTGSGIKWEFWPGPLDAEGNPPADCTPFDRMFKVSRADLEHFEQTGKVTDDLRDWPAHLGAPTLDGDGNPDNFDLEAGDRPEILGDQTIWWVMNDAGGEKQWSETAPFPMEVQVTAYALRGADVLHTTTFYRYRLVYRGEAPFEAAYFGIWIAAALGNASDDYVGSDTLRDMGFTYNGRDFDSGTDGYGDRPPALGYVFLETPFAETDGLDNDDDGEVDEPGEQQGMSVFLSYNGNDSVIGNPTGDTDQPYLYLQGRWRDGSRMTVGGNGFGGSEETSYMFPGNPAQREFWSEENTDGKGSRNTPAYRRFLMSTGPFTMQPGESQDITYAIVWSRSANRLLSVAQLKRDADRVRAFFGGGQKPPPLPEPPATPLLLSPNEDAEGLIALPQFAWRAAGDSLYYLIQVDDDPSFSSPEIQKVVFDKNTFEVEEALENETTFHWRVRAENLGGFSPWSEVRAFTTGATKQPDLGITSFETVANAAGPILPPTGAAADFQDFPVPERPDERQQVGDGIWMINTGATSAGTSYDAFVSRTIRNGWEALGRSDYEIRFTARCHDAWQAAHDAGTPFATPADGCYAYDRFSLITDAGDTPILVPFELWRIGVGTPDDPSDDVRLIPAVIDWEEDGFNLQCFDTSASGADNDPESDWVYWYHPNDQSPGEIGYDEWAAALLAGTTPYTHGGEVMGRMVWFNWNGGSVDGCTVENKATHFDQAMPEAGTVFRLVTSKPLSLTREGRLAGLNVVPPVVSAATGSLILAGTPDALRLSGAFNALEGAFTSAVLFSGKPGEVGDTVAVLTAAVSPEGRSGTFPSDRNVITTVGNTRDLYVLIRTDAFPGGELRGHLLPPGNDAPDTTVPFAASTLSLEGPGGTPFTVTWDPAPDPNANPVVYTWQLAPDADFTSLLANIPVGTATTLRLSFTELEALLATAGVPAGQEVTLYHRLLSSDGSLTRVGSAQALRLTRGVVVATEGDDELPARFALHGNYPNPFNPVTTLVFDLPQPAEVTVAVYDVLGRQVLVRPAQPMAAGAARQMRLDGSRLASGVYFYRIEAKAAQTTWRETGRLVLVK